VRWTAPEALEERKFSEKTDAWSFGVTLYEIWTKAALPYGKMNNQKVWVEVAHGLRLPRPETCSTEVYAAMRACWAAVQDQRPSMQQMMELLRQLESCSEREIVPHGHASKYKTQASTLSRDVSVMSKDSVHEHTLSSSRRMGRETPVHTRSSEVSVIGRESTYEYMHSGSMVGRESDASIMGRESVYEYMPNGSMIQRQTQSPFHADQWRASGVDATHRTGAGEMMHDDLSIDGTVYDADCLINIDRLMETDPIAMTSAIGGNHYALSGGDDTEDDEKNKNRADAEVAVAACDLRSTGAEGVGHRRTGTLRSQMAPDMSGTSPPPITPRVLNLAWKTPERTQATLTPTKAHAIHGNEGGDDGSLRNAIVGPLHEHGSPCCGVELDEVMSKTEATPGRSSCSRERVNRDVFLV
jgi:hypothetical protein